MFHHSKLILALSAVVALAAACAQPIETRPVSAELAPLEYRAPVLGDRMVWQDGDDQIVWTVAGMSDGLVTSASSTGCRWTGATLLAPSTRWENCDPFSDGTHTYAKTGEIFPLQVGNAMSFDASGSNVDGDTWDNVRTCTVDGTAQVDVPAGTFDTYRVICDDGNTRRTFFYAPETGTPVMYERLRRNQNERRLYKLVSFTPGAAA
ncbi:MAG: hypothetical protein AAF674_06180 [Pseudomonadota bacterium]